MNMDNYKFNLDNYYEVMINSIIEILYSNEEYKGIIRKDKSTIFFTNDDEFAEYNYAEIRQGNEVICKVTISNEEVLNSFLKDELIYLGEKEIQKKNRKIANKTFDEFNI